MQRVDHFLGAGIPGLIEDHAAPVIVVAPVIPVLHDVIDGNAALAVLLRDAQQFVAGGVVLLALPVAIGPFAVQRRLAGKLPVTRDLLIDGGPVEEVIIDVIGDLGPEGGLAGGVVEDGFGVVIPEDSVPAMVLACTIFTV
jgi:hypothetical protein